MQQVSSKAMSIPGKALAGVIHLLEDHLPKASFAELSEFHRLVVEDLRSQGNQGDSRLAALLPGIKRMVGISPDIRDLAEADGIPWLWTVKPIKLRDLA